MIVFTHTWIKFVVADDIESSPESEPSPESHPSPGSSKSGELLDVVGVYRMIDICDSSFARLELSPSISHCNSETRFVFSSMALCVVRMDSNISFVRKDGSSNTSANVSSRSDSTCSAESLRLRCTFDNVRNGTLLRHSTGDVSTTTSKRNSWFWC